ncbi:hypothetical protein C8Q70DRAFT_596091 [Cubamyces menziesii]|nr:hypothetical protein C8Q70DRAFT_596091 [Cubamyces menziesii]
MQTFSAVTTLSLIWRDSGTFADLVRFLSVFPNLRSVSLTGYVWRPGSTLPVMRSRGFPTLSRLFLLNGLVIEHSMEGDVTSMLLQTIADSVRILGVSLSAIPHTALDERMMTAQTLPCLQTLHYFGSPPPLAEHLLDLQYKYVADWAFRSAPVLKNIVFHLPLLVRPARMKCRIVRRFIQTLVGIHLADNILPHLSRMATKITLFLCDDFPRETERQKVLAATSILCVRRIISRFERCPEMNVVWGGLTESFQTVYLTATDHDGEALKISYLPPPEIADCLEEVWCVIHSTDVAIIFTRATRSVREWIFSGY